MTTTASTFAETLAATCGALEELERAVASLGELPADTLVAFDEEEWAEKLSLREPPLAVLTSAWMMRG